MTLAELPWGLLAIPFIWVGLTAMLVHFMTDGMYWVYRDDQEERAYRDAAADSRRPILREYDGFSPREARYHRLWNAEYQKEINQITDQKWRAAHQWWCDHNWRQIAKNEKKYAKRQVERDYRAKAPRDPLGRFPY